MSNNKNTLNLKQTIVIGVDPAPSKGLCVYAQYPENLPLDNEKRFLTYYGTDGRGLENFKDRVNELSKSHPVLICWDAPLTMPSDYYTREIEKLAKPVIPGEQNPYSKDNKPDRKSWYDQRREDWKAEKCNMASVQSAAGCTHWVISQKVLGFPRFGAKSPDIGLDAKLIFDVTDIVNNGIYLTEVHPALAIQVRIGRNRIRKFKAGGKLSGDNSYKNVSWRRSADPEQCDFISLWEAAQQYFLSDASQQIPFNEIAPSLDPSDHLDAWVAMMLGVLWIKGKEVRCYGNEKCGSFLLPNKEFAAAEEHEDLDRIDAV